MADLSLSTPFSCPRPITPTPLPIKNLSFSSLRISIDLPRQRTLLPHCLCELSCKIIYFCCLAAENKVPNRKIKFIWIDLKDVLVWRLIALCKMPLKCWGWTRMWDTVETGVNRWSAWARWAEGPVINLWINQLLENLDLLHFNSCRFSYKETA